MLGQVREDEIGGDWRHLVEPRFTKLALDVEVLGEAEAAMRLDRDIRRLEAGIGRQHLGHVGLGAAGLIRLEAAQRLGHHEACGAHVGIGAGNGKLDALILADGTPEDHAFPGIGR